MKKLSVKEVGPKEVSECCGANILTIVKDEGTSFWVCASCRRSCNPKTSETNEGTGVTKEMIERSAKYSNDKQAELANEAIKLDTLSSSLSHTPNYTPKTNEADYLKELRVEIKKIMATPAYPTAPSCPYCDFAKGRDYSKTGIQHHIRKAHPGKENTRIDRITTLFSSSIERARREGYEEGVKVGRAEVRLAVKLEKSCFS